MWDKPLPLRPHHGLCMAFFQGKGYSSGFTSSLAACLDALERDIRKPVMLTVGTDTICAPCPHNVGCVCEAADKVASYDRAVLELCRLQEGTICPFSEFAQLVQQRIIDSGARRAICGNCQWDRLCTSTPSRWADARFR